MARKTKLWRYQAGRRPHTVTVLELDAGGPIYLSVYLKREGRIAYRSLKHRDKKQAIDQAERLAAKRREGAEAVATGTVTLERVFRLYRAHQTPKKAPATQVEDERRIELFTNAWGKGKSPYAINLAQWDALIAARRTGAIDSHGRVVKPEHRVPVRDGTVFADLSWLQTVCAWAARWRTGEDGTYLLRENPVRGFDAPRERNPRRPLATETRFRKILAVAPQLRMEMHWGEQPKSVPTYLPSLLILANGTGRRISAICSLKFADLRPNLGPHGSIRWPADTDKMGLESVVPVTREVREVLDRIQRERPGMGAAPLFPGPKNPGAPIRYELASTWLLEAEKLAGLPKQDGSLWHAFRRKWATERKALPDVDVAAAGGWKSPRTLVELYQRPDAATMYKVVSEGTKLVEELG